MNETPRRYEKVDAHTVKLIVEKSSDMELSTLIGVKEQLTAQIKDLNERLDNVNEILAEAKKLGITPKPKDIKKKENK